MILYGLGDISDNETKCITCRTDESDIEQQATTSHSVYKGSDARTFRVDILIRTRGFSLELTH